METFILSLPVVWGDGVWELGGGLQAFTDGNPYPQRRAGLWWEDSVHRASLRRGWGLMEHLVFSPEVLGSRCAGGSQFPLIQAQTRQNLQGPGGR